MVIHNHHLSESKYVTFLSETRCTIHQISKLESSLIKPYRFHQRHVNRNSGENIYPSYVPHSRNRNSSIQEDDHRTIVSSRDTNGSWGKHAHSRDNSRQRMTYDRTRDRSRHTEYSRPQQTSRRNENRETRDMSETRHRYNRTRSPRDTSRQLMTELVTEADTLNTLDLNTPVDVMKTEKHGI